MASIGDIANVGIHSQCGHIQLMWAHIAVTGAISRYGQLGQPIQAHTANMGTCNCYGCTQLLRAGEVECCNHNQCRYAHC